MWVEDTVVHAIKSWHKTRRSTQWTILLRVQGILLVPCKHQWHTVCKLIHFGHHQRALCASPLLKVRPCLWVNRNSRKRRSASITWRTWYSSMQTWGSQSSWGKRQWLRRSANSTNRNNIAGSPWRSKRPPAWPLKWATSLTVELSTTLHLKNKTSEPAFAAAYFRLCCYYHLS